MWTLVFRCWVRPRLRKVWLFCAVSQWPPWTVYTVTIVPVGIWNLGWPGLLKFLPYSQNKWKYGVRITCDKSPVRWCNCVRPWCDCPLSDSCLHASDVAASADAWLGYTTQFKHELLKNAYHTPIYRRDIENEQPPNWMWTQRFMRTA